MWKRLTSSHLWKADWLPFPGGFLQGLLKPVTLLLFVLLNLHKMLFKYLFKEWKYQTSNCMIFWGVLCKTSISSLKSLETLGDFFFFFARVCCVMNVIGIFCFSDHLLCPLEMSLIHPIHKGNNSLYKHRTSQLQLPIHSGDIQE